MTITAKQRERAAAAAAAAAERIAAGVRKNAAHSSMISIIVARAIVESVWGGVRIG